MPRTDEWTSFELTPHRVLFYQHKLMIKSKLYYRKLFSVDEAVRDDGWGNC